MVKKKSWIDKKKATRYTLVYRSTDDHDEAPGREFVPTDQLGVHEPRQPTPGRYPPGHPLAFLNEQEPLSEERRREIIALGFPDDGYDYLKHLRRRGAVAASVERSPDEATDTSDAALAGPSTFVPAATFVPPTPDVRVVDARAMRLTSGAADEAEADDRLFTVTAYSREVGGVQGALRRELLEVEALMEELEDASEDAEQDGDLQDDFVLEAMTRHDGDVAGGSGLTREQAAVLAAGGSAVAHWDSEEEEEEEEMHSSDGVGSDGWDEGDVLPREGQRRGGSIASTYWRPERHDRNDALSMIDERFERLALEYEDEDIGDLEDDDGVQGEADAVRDYGQVLDRFLDAHSTRRTRLEWPAAAGGAPEDASPSHAPPLDEAEEQRQLAVKLAREYGHACEQAAEEDGPRAVDLGALRPANRTPQWDCESVLSRLTNTDNHPGRIAEPSKRKPAAVVLSDRGIPVGYEPSRSRQAPAAPPTPHKRPPAPSRPRGETAEERRERKAAVKEAKRASREVKKEFKRAFKEEHVRQQTHAACNPAASVLPIS